MRLIPSIDIINGSCVRLTRGDFKKIETYKNDPVEYAKELENAGIEYLHMIDLDGARLNRIVNYSVLNNIAKSTKLKIDFGGGLLTSSDVDVAFENGASQIIGGTVAVNNPTQFIGWLEKYGSEKVILAADTKHNKIAINAWENTTKHDVIEFITNYEKLGIKHVICTDISKDGTLSGASNNLYQEILSKSQISLIASGGVSNMSDLATLEEIGCEGAILGKALFENKISLKELTTFISKSSRSKQ
jgi:phosphoribosylformimino-5-aminoimidazole carboxamide ribotide isomerase